MTVRTARCHCGDLALRCTGEPAKISLCHCRDCQRRTGSAFSVAVFYGRGQVEISGEARRYQRPSAGGDPVDFHFCGRCGANLYWLPERLPHLVGVALGAFEDPAFGPPHQSVWNRDRHPWVGLPEDIPHFDENPLPRESK